MTPRLPRIALWLAIAATSCGLTATAGARSEEWKDANGNTFNAAPSEVLGPWAVFDNGTMLPLNLLSNVDCVRFHDRLKDAPTRAANWKDATSKVSGELYGRLMHYSGNDLVKDDEKGRVEPEFYMIFYSTNDKNMTWNMLRRSTPALYSKMIRDYPDLVQGVVFGVGEEMSDHFDLAVNTHGEWMYTVFQEEVQMRTLKTTIPTNLYGIVVVTRDGVPLLGPDASTDEEVKATFGKLTGMMKHVQGQDVRDWQARAHYFMAVQPVAFASGHSDPLLMGNPLVPAVLRQMKLYNVDATFKVAADGTISSVQMKPGEMAPATEKMFVTGFQRGCLFVPAVDNGKFVDGTYEYHMTVAP
jgi:hypothetical protein